MLATFLASFISLSVISQEAKPDPRENVDTAVKEAIRLVEAKEIATFIMQFAHPDDLKKILKGKTIEELAEQFSAQKSANLLLALKEIDGKKPELSEDGTQAMFKVDLKTAPGGRIVFQKSGKLWYIRN